MRPELGRERAILIGSPFSPQYRRTIVLNLSSRLADQLMLVIMLFCDMPVLCQVFYHGSHDHQISTYRSPEIVCVIRRLLRTTKIILEDAAHHWGNDLVLCADSVALYEDLFSSCLLYLTSSNLNRKGELKRHSDFVQRNSGYGGVQARLGYWFATETTGTSDQWH